MVAFSCPITEVLPCTSVLTSRRRLANDTKLWLSNMWLSEDLIKKIWSHMEVSCKGVTPSHHPKLE